MASLKVRGRMLYVCWYDRQSGQPRSKSTGFTIDQREEAEAVLREVERALAAADAPKGLSGGMTFEAFAESWIQQQEEDEKNGVAQEARRLRNHAYPLIGEVVLKDFTKPAALEFIRNLKRATKKSNRRSKARVAEDARTREKLAPRTVHNIAQAVRTVFQAATEQELIPFNPCGWKKNNLPDIVDTDLERRITGVFTPEEIYRLITEEVIPENRRDAYAMEFLTGMRPGEVSARRFRDVTFDIEPLPMLTVKTAYNTDRKREGATKTKVTKVIPIHPALRVLLERWRDGGFERWQGRPPTPDDLIFPTKRGKFRNASKANKLFQVDLEKLGMRKRVHYDTRATFRSLAIAAKPDLDRFVDLITHPSKGDIKKVYDRLAIYWPRMCEAVSAIAVPLPPAKQRDGA